MVKLSQGLDKLARQLGQISEAFAADDGKIGELRFDPNDPASIEAAIVEMERLVDAKTLAFPGNPLLNHLGEQMKEKYRARIVERAAELRAGAGASGEGEGD